MMNNSDLRSRLPYTTISRPYTSLTLGCWIILSYLFPFLIFSFTPLSSFLSLLTITITLNSSTSSLLIWLLPLTVAFSNHALEIVRFPLGLNIFKNFSNYPLVAHLLTSLHCTQDIINPL